VPGYCALVIEVIKVKKLITVIQSYEARLVIEVIKVKKYY